MIFIFFRIQLSFDQVLIFIKQSLYLSQGFPFYAGSHHRGSSFRNSTAGSFETDIFNYLIDNFEIDCQFITT